MNRLSGVNKLIVALASICFVTAAAANASTIEFRILTNGADVATYAGAAGLVNLTIQVRTTDCVFYDDETYGAYISGVTQYSYSLQDSTGIAGSSLLAPKQGSLPTPPFLPNGKWASTSVTPPFTHTLGEANKTKVGVGDYDVLGETGMMANADLGTYGMNYGGGVYAHGTTTGDWATITTGQFNYSGGSAKLTLVADRLAQTVFNGATGSYQPSSVITDSIAFGAISNNDPKIDSVSKSQITESDWDVNGGQGYNNPLHSIDISAVGSDQDPGTALTYRWKMTKPGVESLTLGETGGVLHMTIADIASLGLPVWGVDTNMWSLSVEAYDGIAYSAPTVIPTFVPEPATMGLLAFGFVSLLKRRRCA